eukprot:COSAG05_NODE_1943_length_3799_cov_21.288649_4_plen_150_part_00
MSTTTLNGVDRGVVVTLGDFTEPGSATHGTEMSSQRLSCIRQHLLGDALGAAPPAVTANAAADDELLVGLGSETTDLQEHQLRSAVKTTLDRLGPRERVLILPPVSVSLPLGRDVYRRWDRPSRARTGLHASALTSGNRDEADMRVLRR